MHSCRIWSVSLLPRGVMTEFILYEHIMLSLGCVSFLVSTNSYIGGVRPLVQWSCAFRHSHNPSARRRGWSRFQLPNSHGAQVSSPLLWVCSRCTNSCIILNFWHAAFVSLTALCQCVVVSVVVNRVATYRELDNDLLQHAQFLSLDNEVDLKLLAKSLSAEADVQEVGLCFIAKT